MATDQKDFLKLHFLVIILGFTAILGKLISVDSIALVIFRTFFASVGLGIIFFLKGNKLQDSRKTLQLLLVGLVLGVHWICFFGSARMGTVSLCLVTFSTTSFFTSILEPLVNKEKFSPKDIFLGFLAVLGMFLIFKFEFQHLNAILIGLLGAILSAIYTIANARLVKTTKSITINFYELCGAFLSVSILFLIAQFAGFLHNINFQITGMDLIWLLILAIGCTVYPYLEMVNLLKKFSAFSINLAINMEPIYGILMAWLFFGKDEKMTGGFYAGAILILSSLILNAYWRKQEKALSEDI